MAKTKDDLGLKVGRYLRAIELGKKRYKTADAIMDELAKELEPGQVVRLATGKQFCFVDKFAKTSRINVGMNARRFEFEEVLKT